MKTRKFCPQCGRPVVKIYNQDHVFWCFACDTHFSRSEVYNTREIEQVRKIRRDAYRWEVKNKRTPHSFKKNYPIPAFIKNRQYKYVILQRPDPPELCADQETLFESVEIRTETDRIVEDFNSLHREIAIYNHENPNYKFTIKTIRSSIAKHKKRRNSARSQILRSK